jgi:MSHA biogenesis protein MshE
VRQKVRIGDLLLRHGVITEDQLQTALAEQKKRKLKLGRVLVELGYLGEDELLTFLGRQFDLPLVDLTQHPLDLETIRLLPETHARRHRAIVLEDRGEDLLVAIADPTEILATDEIARVLHRPLRLAIARERDLLRILDLAYRRTDEITNLAGELRRELSERDFELGESLDSGDQASSAPVARLLSSIFEDAVQVAASDVHIEPDENELRIRLRVDGVLHEQVMQEKRIAGALVQRIKLISGLDISEKRLPQDGRFRVTVRGREIDVRLSTLPVQHGESVVMRLLDRSTGLLELGALGLGPDLLSRLRRILGLAHGMLLVTGPTGSGKTTTIYAALSELNRAERKMVTVEDPVEYRLPRVNQVQVNPKIGLTFSQVLRSALRHDPDIVMVGEIRDQETASIALRAAMTGHLVLSTLHTNDAISSVIRLMDMGAEGYLVASSLRAVLAQRLVRRICERCAEPYRPSPEDQVALVALLGPEVPAAETRRGSGCGYCNHTGYRGRIGVFELLDLDAAMANALRSSDTAQYVELAERQVGPAALTRAALDRAREGTTCFEEVLRVAGHLEAGAPWKPPRQVAEVGSR